MPQKNFVCSLCEEDDPKHAFFHTTKLLVGHYEKEHPDYASVCFNAVGDTWDPQLTALLRDVSELKLSIRKEQEANETLRHKNSDLLSKLNGIILLLRD